MSRSFLLIVGLFLLSGCSKIPRPVDDYKAEQSAAQAAKLPKDPDDSKNFSDLKLAGHDFTKAANVEFYLYFPEEGAARGALQVLSSDGYSGEVKQEKGEWLCLLHKSLVLTADVIDLERFKMKDLTVNSGGHYEGWIAVPVK